MTDIAIRVENLCERYRRLALCQADRYRCSKARDYLLWLNLKMLWLTVGAVLQGEGGVLTGKDHRVSWECGKG